MGKRIYGMTVAAMVYSGEKAQLLHAAWVGALVFMALFLVAAAAEFFWMDIPGVLALESGMAARKRLRQLNERAELEYGKPEEFVIERDIVIVHTDERIDGW